MSNLPIPYDHKGISNLNNPILLATNRFLMEVKRDYPETTAKTYFSKMKIFNEWVEGFSMSNDTRSDLKAFRAFLIERYTSGSSINLCLSVVRSF